MADQIKRLIPTARFVDAVCTSSIKKYPDIPIPDEKRYEEDYSVFAEIQKQREVWFYTCALPGGKFCNRLLDIPLIKTRIMYWGAAKYRLSGYLHWGFNCYRLGQNPYTDLCPRFSAVHEERYLPPGDTHLVYPGPEGPYSGWDDYAVQTDLAVTNWENGDAVGLLGRYQDANNYYLWRIGNVQGNNVLQLYKKVSGTFTKLYEHNETFDAFDINTLKLVMDDSTVKGYLNGVLKVNIEDTSFTTGSAGVRGYATSYYIDNICITDVATDTLAQLPQSAVLDTFCHALLRCQRC